MSGSVEAWPCQAIDCSEALELEAGRFVAFCSSCWGLLEAGQRSALVDAWATGGAVSEPYRRHLRAARTTIQRAHLQERMRKSRKRAGD